MIWSQPFRGVTSHKGNGGFNRLRDSRMPYESAHLDRLKRFNPGYPKRPTPGLPKWSARRGSEGVLVRYGRYSFGGGDVGRSPGPARPPSVIVAIEEIPAPMPLARKVKIEPSRRQNLACPSGPVIRTPYRSVQLNVELLHTCQTALRRLSVTVRGKHCHIKETAERPGAEPPAGIWRSPACRLPGGVPAPTAP